MTKCGVIGMIAVAGMMALAPAPAAAQGTMRPMQKPTSGPVKKANPLDRCPVAYFTDPGNATLCTTKAANPPSIRLKGAGQCNPGELDDWGLYCVSNYENLLVKDAPEGTAGYNNIYKNSYGARGKTSRPNQEALP